MDVMAMSTSFFMVSLPKNGFIQQALRRYHTAFYRVHAITLAWQAHRPRLGSLKTLIADSYARSGLGG